MNSNVTTGSSIGTCEARGVGISADLRIDGETDERIGVFDSGVGGLSVLRALHERLPDAAKIYIGDVAHSPYGERAAGDVLARCESLSEFLIAKGATVVVVACNTASAVAIEALRERWPHIAFVGVEPGVKPAVALTRSKRIAVMATSGTIASERMRRLVAAHAEGVHVHLQACPGLASAIERGALQGQELRDVLAPFCANVLAQRVDTVVLGCTHYPFVIDAIRELLGPGVAIVDTACAVAERAAFLWAVEKRVSNSRATYVFSTGSSKVMSTLLQRCPGLEDVRVQTLSM